METLQSSSGRDFWLSWALALSLLLHGLILWLVPHPDTEQPPEPSVLVVNLLQPQPEPKPVPKAEPLPPPTQIEARPRPPKPPKSPKKPEIKPEPKPNKKEAPAPARQEPVTSPPPQQELAETSPPAMTAPPSPAQPSPAQPPMEAPPLPPPPPPPVPEPVGPSAQEVEDARNSYGSLLAREIAKHKKYPRIAQMRGWQGEAIVELQIDGNGALIASKIFKSSSYEALDKQALEMVKKASPFPAAPGALRGKNFTIQVPVNFRLE